jgi:large subunit ribosomal protein L22
MKTSAVAKYVRVAPSKIRPLARLLKGFSLDKALTAVQFNNKKGAFFIGKLLESMKASLADKKLDKDDFIIENIVIEQGPGLKRYWSRSRGMVRPVVKRTSHIKIILTGKQNDIKEK